MANRKFPFQTGQFYHITNRSINHEKIFLGLTAHRLLNIMRYCSYDTELSFGNYNRLSKMRKEAYLEPYQRKIQVAAWAIMPTHFHLLCSENEKGALHKFITRIQISFAKYYNALKSRHGHVFSEQFKGKEIDTIQYFLEVSRYIHNNPVKASLTTPNGLWKYPYTSFKYYSNSYDPFTQKELVLKYFDNNPKKYHGFLSTSGVTPPESPTPGVANTTTLKRIHHRQHRT